MEPDRSVHARRWASGTTTWLLGAGFVASFFGLLAWLGRPGVSGGTQWPTDGPWSLVAALAAAFGLGAAAGIWHARGSARRTASSLVAMIGAGERMLVGKAGPRIPAPPQPELAPLAGLLNRVADLHDATSAVLADRDAQLSTIGRLSGLVYWEQDASGRYTRIETGAGGRPEWIAGLLGRTRWETGGRALGRGVAGAASTAADTPDWDEHRAQTARRAPIGDLVWSPPPVGGRSVFLREIGLPRYSEEGEFVGYRGVMREIGAELAAERVAQNLAARLREREGETERRLSDALRRARELEHAARELEAFSYTVSHDLRAPLRVVDGFARIVKEDYTDSLGHVGVDHLDRILSAAARMNQMIDALLRLAKVSSEPITFEAVDLSALAHQVVDELRTQQPERQVEVAIDDGMQVEGNQTLLRLVLENLIGNAWKYSARQVRARIGFGATREAEGTTVFCVSDNGAGFDMRFAQRLFRVFQRLHSAEEFPGTGVGLATAARIVHRHGGRIWADSKPDEGARFYFSLQPDDAPRASAD